MDDKQIIACPNCNQRLSVPSGLGVLADTCPRCRFEWDWAAEAEFIAEGASTVSAGVWADRAPPIIDIDVRLQRLIHRPLPKPERRFERWVESPEQAQDASACVIEADAHRKQCRFVNAISAASEAIRLDPGNALAYAVRAESYRCKSEFELAIDDATRAIRLNHPDAAFVYRTRGECFLRTNQFDRAISDASEAIRLDPTDAFSFGTRGMAFCEKGEFAKAFADLAEAHRLEPDNVLMAINLEEVKRRWVLAQPLSFERRLAFNTNAGEYSICGYELDGIRDDWHPQSEPLVIATAHSREEAEEMIRTMILRSS